MRAANFSEDAIEQLMVAYAQLPLAVKTDVKADTTAAVRNLEEVKHKLQATKGKSITVDALTKDARKAHEDLGYKIKNHQREEAADHGADRRRHRRCPGASRRDREPSQPYPSRSPHVHRTVQNNTLGRPATGRGEHVEEPPLAV
ncbi:hypothetical protein MBT42_18475 [Streptomyces sp. MBT42]|uniref:hypothetical protein n=1 Tax=Streptomyces sp. MBT42 TaxID=1488373 RepID=UPI001E54AD21|nr:hypothetical protein [Streptomyces sp. MBT42]MCD2465543.1 hypothetical protein [Streptomyces sp. MBT42]